MVKLTNLARVGSSILLIGVMLFVYANLPKQVGIIFNEYNVATYKMEKGSFFYLSLIIFLSLNLITVVFVKLFDQVPVNTERVFFSSEVFKENFLGWLGSFASVMNLFFIFVYAYIGIFNNGDRELIESYGYLAFLGQFLVLGWLISLVVIISKRK